MADTLRPVLTVRIFRREKCFGPGIAQLLTRVRELRSLRAAAQSMEMAYSKAWTIVRRSEAELGFPLLHTRTGGKNGGGAVLTDAALALLDAYTHYVSALNETAQALFSEHFSAFLPEGAPGNTSCGD